jgi:hypothetical protein
MSHDEKRTQFDYLLNAMEHAAREAHPAKAGYAGKRKALFAYVRELERKAALYDASGVPVSSIQPSSPSDADAAAKKGTP